MVAGQGEAPVRELSPLQNATGLLRNTALLNDRMAAVRRAPRTRLTVWGAMPYRVFPKAMLCQTYLYWYDMIFLPPPFIFTFIQKNILGLTARYAPTTISFWREAFFEPPC